MQNENELDQAANIPKEVVHHCQKLASKNEIKNSENDDLVTI